MLKLSGVNAFYGKVQVLYDVSMEVKEGEVVALIGANASGKTTTLSCISRTMTSFEGSIAFKGKRIDKAETNTIVDMGLVQVPEGRLLFPALTVKENLVLGAYNKRSRANREKNLDFVYHLLPRLQEREKQLAGSLSGGEAQMCAIGRGLMANPELLILDEPSLGLAPIVVLDIMKLIKEIKRNGVTVLLVEQNVKQSLKLADRAYILSNGKIISEGGGKELLNSDIVKRAYLGV
ncbi:ABC transporter ATP-binding protein [Caproiciproducens sp.]